MTPRSAPRLGFGASGPWGASWFDADRAREIFERAVTAGVRDFDTAGFYGAGEAERRLGRFMAGHPEIGFQISSKTGTRLGRGGKKLKDFSEAAILEDVAASLERLGRPHLDCLYLHGPSPGDVAAAAPILASLKASGEIRHAGVCGRGPELEAALDAGGYDALMAPYNFADPSAGPLFERARAAGISVAGVAPLAQGLYTEAFWRLRGAADAWRIARGLVRDPQAVRAGRATRRRLEGESGRPAPEAALAFALAGPLDVVFTTTTNSAHLDQSLALWRRARASETDTASGR